MSNKGTGHHWSGHYLPDRRSRGTWGSLTREWPHWPSYRMSVPSLQQWKGRSRIFFLFRIVQNLCNRSLHQWNSNCYSHRKHVLISFDAVEEWHWYPSRHTSIGCYEHLPCNIKPMLLVSANQMYGPSWLWLPCSIFCICCYFVYISCSLWQYVMFWWVPLVNFFL